MNFVLFYFPFILFFSFHSAYSVFFDEYRENVAATVSTAVNNAYITSHNQPQGVKSYGLVVDLAVAYYLPKTEP